MRVHFDSGTVVFSSAEEAAEGLKRHGFTVGPYLQRDPKSSWLKRSTHFCLGLWWGPVHDYQESIREKLKGFQRPSKEDNTMDE